MKSPFESAPVFYKEKTGSTMEDMKALRHAGHGAVLFTGFQAGGRGRIPGRQWQSAQDENLLMTLQLERKKITAQPYQIPLLSGLGIARFLEENYGLDASIKWPNDVLIGGKKISGILCEARADWISVGIGLNCLQTKFEESFRKRSTSISLQSAIDCTPRRILPGLLEQLQASYKSSEWRENILARLYGLNTRVFLKEGLPENEELLAVEITGISEEGFLKIRNCGTGIEKILMAGEISFPEYNLN